jgi:HSP20 family molecular chaperone IbpA
MTERDGPHGGRFHYVSPNTGWSSGDAAVQVAAAVLVLLLCLARHQKRILLNGDARRAFERRFSLADHMKVVGASLDNGLLYVDVVHEVPEEAKPRKIAIGIGQAEQPQVVEKKAA